MLFGQNYYIIPLCTLIIITQLIITFSSWHVRVELNYFQKEEENRFNFSVHQFKKSTPETASAKSWASAQRKKIRLK
jgi:hypothetical protein